MTDRKRILIIDDNFEIALFLRTTLEIIWPTHEVINVPSGEEGLLEVRRGRPDVVILDLKLPGIDGLEFIDKVERLAPDAPIIVITGERSPELHQQVRARGVAGFFLKPLHVDDISGAVRQLLEGGPAPGDGGEPPVQLSPPIVRRLSALRVDTGADYVMLIDFSGRCLTADGQPGDLNTARLASLLAATLTNAAELAQALRAPQPFTLNYQAGTHHDLYAASVGAGYLIALVFDAHHGRGKVGAVWLYTRRAVKELLDLLGSEPPAPAPTSEPPASAVGAVREPPGATPKPPGATRKPPVPTSEPPAAVADIKPEPPAADGEPEPAAAPEPAAPAPAERVVYSPEEIDAFWDSVLSEEEGDDGPGFSGLSFQEARARGIIPSDFDPS